MNITQLTMLLPNDPGALSKVSEILGENGINIIALTVADLGDIGRLRFIANDPERAFNVLRTAGYEVNKREVIAVETPHHPGGLNAILKPLKMAGVNVNYLYPALSGEEKAVLVLGVDKNEEAVKALRTNWINLLGTEIYSL
ncbi:MAG: ACT domain-containing protein [Deltaproteobacteria bacterium]|nr:ACT domain-containing protein [Deltaproteobacteria bacterium]MBF0525562.1 ACT domain-containing protein [Deltaproteobacteria bacterium]